MASRRQLNLLREKAGEIRKQVLNMGIRSGSGHVASALSCADIMAVLYFDILDIDPDNPISPKRDRFILSKGHGCLVLYTTLALRGFFPVSELERFNLLDSPMGGHPYRFGVPGVEASTGSLGHGLPVGVGVALAGHLDAAGYRVVVLLGDGEQNEGSVWEAAMAAAHYRLGNLIVIVDRNGLQVDGETERVMRLEPLGDKWRSFGWDVQEVDGHDIAALLDVVESAYGAGDGGVPHAIIAHTVKGKGISFMENKTEWHFGVPKGEQATQALKELEAPSPQKRDK